MVKEKYRARGAKRMQIRILMTVANLAISGVVIYLKLLIGNAHAYHTKLLYSIKDSDPILGSKLVYNTDCLATGITILSIISLILAVVLFKEKLNGRIIGILNILLALACVMSSLIVF
jgi:hypothetical protein